MLPAPPTLGTWVGDQAPIPQAVMVYTIGHSNRPFKEFLEVLRAYGIGVVVDIRRFPKSRVVLWSESGTLRELLEAEGILYFWLGDLLGGFRKGGYRAYMETENYRKGLERLFLEC